MSQSYDEFLKASTLVCTQWCRLETQKQWTDIRLPESHGVSWMRITRPLPSSRNEALGSDRSTDTSDLGDDEADPEALEKSVSVPFARLAYEVIHSPTYQVPVLYISVQGSRLPSLDEIYKAVVPEIHRSPMMSIGVMGALSLTEHPLAGTPVFFVHPCRTVEAMQSVLGDQRPSPERYLMLWLGMTGAGVGLSVPVELAESILGPSDGDAQA